MFKFGIPTGVFGRDTVSLVIKPYPVVNFKQSFVCQGITSGFESLSTISEGTMTYKWDFGVANLKSDTSILESPEYDFATKGVYTVSLTVTSDFWLFGDQRFRLCGTSFARASIFCLILYV